MWVKDIRNYDVNIYENDTLIYSGNVKDAPDDIKERETKSIKIDHKNLVIEL